MAIVLTVFSKMKQNVLNKLLHPRLSVSDSVRYKDLNGDGKIDATNDREILGDANPKFFGGMNQHVCL